MKFKKTKKVKNSTLKRKADILFSKKVRSRGVCQLKGLDNVKCSQVLQCAHIIGRANLRLRWDERNALCICSGHHVYYTYHPLYWRELMILYFSSNWNYVLTVEQEKVKVDYMELLLRLA